MNNYYELKTYVDKALLDRIRIEAASRKSSISKTIRECLREYFAIREELATTIQPQSEGTQTTNQPSKIIHVLLARQEETMCREFGKLKEFVFQLMEK